MTTTIDFDARYQVKHWPGVAVYIYGYPQIWEPWTYTAYVDGDGEFCDEDHDEAREVECVDECGEGEWIDDIESGRVLVVMVGDDYKHTVDIDDLIKLDDLDYCAECGQIGCTHDGRPRE